MARLPQCLVCFFIVFLAIATPPILLAQQEPRRQLGIGPQAGVPTGLTAKYYYKKNRSLTILAAINLERFLRSSAYLTHEFPIPYSPLGLVIGPGVFVERNDSNRNKALQAGAGLKVGLNFFVEKFEVYLQTTPAFTLTPETSADLGGSVGLRYYF